jgi:hypothetical protein
VKFFGEPNCHIIDYTKSREVFCLDKNGEFETDDPELIEWIKKNKRFLKHSDELIKCKKCDFGTSNKGELLAHYRVTHPKEGK